MRDVGRAMTAACVGRGLRGGGGIVLAGTSGRLIGPFHDAWVRSDADAGFKWKEFFFSSNKSSKRGKERERRICWNEIVRAELSDIEAVETERSEEMEGKAEERWALKMRIAKRKNQCEVELRKPSSYRAQGK